jgi:hypothetical protein
MDKPITIKKALLISSLFFMTSTTSADVIKITDDATLQQRQGAQYCSQYGISGEEAVVVETAGADMPLSIATKVVIPESWVIKSTGDFDRAVISWKGGLSWPLIMCNIAESEGIFISLDWIRKIVSINVPGATKTDELLAKQNSDTLNSKRQEFKKEQEAQWKKRDLDRSASDTDKKQLNFLVEKQQKSQEANKQLIANLNESKTDLERKINQIKSDLDVEKNARADIENKYAVIDPSLNTPDNNIDATDLYKSHAESWVLPFDDSFEYYLGGGHADIITTSTPATYIAKSGSVESVLRHWADSIGWHVEYRAGVQHNNPYEVTFKGSFFEASRNLISIFIKSDRPINIQFYPDVIIEVDGVRKKGLARVSDMNFERR